MSHIWLGHVTHTNESRTRSVSGIGMGHVTQKNESYHTNKGFISHINELIELNESHTRSISSNRSPSCWNSTRTCIATYQCVMSRIWMSHVTHMNESCHAYEWVMSRIWMGHITYINESRTRCVSWYRVPFVWNSTRTCYVTCQYVMSRMTMSHVTHTNGSCHTYKWVTNKICMRDISICHVTHNNESCHAYKWVMSHI